MDKLKEFYLTVGYCDGERIDELITVEEQQEWINAGYTVQDLCEYKTMDFQVYTY